MSEPDWTTAPHDADVFISGYFRKWVGGQEYILAGSEWSKPLNSWSIERHELEGSFVIERTDPWAEGEERMKVIPQSGNEGEHYDELPELDEFLGTEDNAVDKTGKPDLIEHNNNNKYSRKIKTIVIDGIDHVIYVDVYDVLTAFNTINPAMAHAIKKMLAPGKRGDKSTIQDMNEAIHSIKRAIELEQEK
jgi:hypothetical protein